MQKHKPTYEELEKRVQELEELVFLFDRLMEISPIFVFFKDEQIRAVKLSSNYEQMLGMPLKNLLHKTMDEIFPSDLAKSMIADDQKILREGKVVEVVEELNQKTYYTVKFPMHRKGHPAFLAGYTIDITGLKQTEKALAESEEKYRRFFEFNPDGVVIFEVSEEMRPRKVLACNESAANMQGYRREEFLGLSMNDLICPYSPEEGRRRGEALKNGGRACFESVLIHKDGTLIHAEIHAMLIPYQNQTALMCIARDISERKKKEAEEKEEASQLSRANQDKDRFLAILAHDLRNPFQVLNGYSELLMEGFYEAPPEDSFQLIQKVHQASRQAYQLLEDLLIWSQYRWGRLVLNLQPIYFKIFCEDLKKIFQDSARAKEILIQCSADPGLMFRGDVNILKTILRNLVSNALKFTPKQGTIKISARKESHEVWIEVADNGMGMDESRLNTLWSFSGSAPGLGTEKEKGTGFGLFLCRELTEKHGGKIWAESTPGKGSRFFVALPQNL